LTAIGAFHAKPIITGQRVIGGLAGSDDLVAALLPYRQVVRFLGVRREVLLFS
jgi:hypothetical protein